MKIARVKGTVTGTVKDTALSGQKMLLVEILDAESNVVDPAVVALDVCGSGPGDMVVLAMGSAARLPTETSGIATDATVIAIVDEITVDGKSVYNAQ